VGVAIASAAEIDSNPASHPESRDERDSHRLEIIST